MYTINPFWAFVNMLLKIFARFDHYIIDLLKYISYNEHMEEVNKLTFGERLTQLRKEHGYATRNDFAERLGIPSTTLRNYETDAREPGHTFLRQISEMFNVSVDYLLCLTDEKEVLNTFRLRAPEQKIIEKYRDLDDHGREMVDIVLEKEYDRYHPAITKTTAFPKQVLNAAHDRGATEEEKANAERIMDDDSEWE